MTPFMGVRISWLMLARKSLLARLASSAATRALSAATRALSAVSLARCEFDDEVAAPAVLGDGQDSERYDGGQAGGGEGQEASVQVPVAEHARNGNTAGCGLTFPLRSMARTSKTCLPRGSCRNMAELGPRKGDHGPPSRR